MDAKLVLAVLFLGHFIASNEVGEMKFGEMSDTHSECQGETCLALDTRLNRRSLKHVHKDKVSSLKKVTNRKKKPKLPKKHKQPKKKPSLTNIEQKIHKAAQTKINNLLKVAKSYRKNIRKHKTKSLKLNNFLKKMSFRKLAELVQNLNIATNITLSTSSMIVTFVNESVTKLRTTIESSGESIKELAEKYWSGMMTAEGDHIKEIVDSQSPEDNKNKTEKLVKLIDKIMDCSGHRLMDVYHGAESAIKLLAQVCGSAVIEVSNSDCDKLQSIGYVNKTMQWYIDYACERLSGLTQISSDKFYEIATNCLQFLKQLASNSNKELKNLADLLTEYIHAQLDGNKKQTEDIRKRIKDLYEHMEHSNEQTYNDMVTEVATLVGGLTDVLEKKVLAIQKCKMGKVQTCPEND